VLARGRIQEVRVKPRVTIRIDVCPVQAQLYNVGLDLKWFEEVAGTPWAGRELSDFARMEVGHTDLRDRGCELVRIELFHVPLSCFAEPRLTNSVYPPRGLD
jgi:hypothetical protein